MFNLQLFDASAFQNLSCKFLTPTALAISSLGLMNKYWLQFFKFLSLQLRSLLRLMLNTVTHSSSSTNNKVVSLGASDYKAWVIWTRHRAIQSYTMWNRSLLPHLSLSTVVDLPPLRQSFN